MHIEVLLSSYNGEKFIEEQIDSILNQDVPLHLTVRDDGSSDKTIQIIKKYPQISLIEGKNIGATKSFFSLIESAGFADYYAFSDQDDVWDKDKLRIAIESLEKFKDRPAIYSSNTRLVDSNLNLIRKEDKKPLISLGSAITKNYVTGCTVVFNNNVMNYLKKYNTQDIPFHDWWVNLVCLSVGGISVFDSDCHMCYRQHDNNVVGGNVFFAKKWQTRLKKFFKPYHREIIATQLLEAYSDEMPEENRKLLKHISVGEYDNNQRTGNLIDDFLYWLCVLFKRI